MKILLHAFMILFLCLPGFKVEAVNTEPAGINPTVKIIITIDLGLKKKGCKGFGFCDVTVDVDWMAIPEGKNSVNGYISVINGKVKIEFDRATMSESVNNTYFSNGRFSLEEDFSLPPNVCSALGISGYTLKTGTYAAPATGGVLSVNF